ncbi:uncharacterized protein LOC141890244 isoform X2 [Acropora palmata]|uniref:uncharacterized protein LOC141890244 isoform X2 n=1 Tax=Acropora palmata TaxID=6131 RepID=UPI003DA04D11
MNRPEARVRGNIYCNEIEMRRKEASVDGGIYDFVMENEVIPELKQVPLERREPAWKKKKSFKESPHSCHSLLAAVQRMLCIVTVVVLISFLTAAGTLTLALKMMFTQNNLANKCSTLRESNHDYKKLSYHVQALENNITSLKEAMTNMQTLELIIAKYEHLKNENNETTVWRAIERNREDIIQLNQTVTNVRKMQGPRGPPGDKGSQGSPGPRGPPGYNGTQGAPVSSGLAAHNRSGSVGFSQCHFKEEKSLPNSPGHSAKDHVSIPEKTGQKFIGVHCGTNDAKIVRFSSGTQNGTRWYRCDCKGTQGLLKGQGQMFCFIRFWECPV